MTTEPTSLITEEMVEKAARAIIDRPPATIAGDYRLGRAKCDARACLEAVLPMVGERMGEIDLYRALAREGRLAGLKEALEIAVTPPHPLGFQTQGDRRRAEAVAAALRARIDELEKGEK
jgi:hypothetical protein